ncbi:MAG: hypothetical protein PUB32_09805 [Clostridiales bacterium]|nr:hypothetical protein [Clostridiales bacterium]
MKNRIKLTAVLCVLALLLSGCSGMFDKEYREEEPYVDEYFEIKDDSSVQEVKSYQGMKNALMNLINSAAEYGIIKTEKYKGDVEDDISRACFEVTREEPMGIYAVDYITHSINRIVSYYEMEIYITYKRSAEEIDSVVTILSGKDMQVLINEALENFESSLAVMQVSTEIKTEDVEAFIDAFYRSFPQLIPQKPGVSVNDYAAFDSVVKRITEVEFHYGLGVNELQRRTESLSSYAQDVLESSYRADIGYICRNVMERCVPLQTETGCTAYDALIGSGQADSEGYAMAVKLLCNLGGVECYVVEGRMNNEKHFWNVVNVDSGYCHVDVYVDDAAGRGEPTFLSDEDMLDAYSWDAECCPVCEKPAEKESVSESEENMEE